MKIPFVMWDRQYANNKEEMDRAVLGCLERGDYIQRGEIERFESHLAEFTGRKYAISLNSGTDAIYMSMLACGIGKGDEVITVSHTFIASMAAIAQTGATPVLIDVNYSDYLMNVNLIEEAITEKTKAIMPVHYNGRICDMDRIMKIAEEHNLIVIEDSAQAFGVVQNGKKGGSWGKTGCFSFYPSKVMGACGDAGGVVTDDPQINEYIRLLQDHGRKTKTQTVMFGINSRLDEIQAALLNVKFNRIESIFARKQEVCWQYNNLLEGIQEVELAPLISQENYVIKATRRDELHEYLKEKGIETQIKDPESNHKIPEVAKLCRTLDLPMTEKLETTVLSLPMNTEITDDEIDYIGKTIQEFYALST